MKKFFFFTLLAALGFAPHVLAAQGFTALAPIPGLTDTTAVSSTATIGADTLAKFFNSLYKYCVGLAAALAVIQITWAGINVATHQDNVSELMSSKGKIYNAIFGLILVLSPYLVFSIINPSILNLSLNLPALQTITTAPVTSTPVTGTVYTNSTQIPTGQVCYAQKGTTSDPTQPPQFVCFTAGTDCGVAAKKDTSAINGECKIYPL